MDNGYAEIRPAVLADSDCLGTIAPAAYAAAYGELWDRPADLARHLRTFGAEAFRDTLRDQGKRVWLAEVRGEIVGFLTLTLHSPDPVRQLPGGAELPRIYLLPGARGKGIGRLLFEAGSAAAAEAGRTYLWLDVMDTAASVQRVYANWGFQPIGRSDFPGPLRPEVRGMRVLARQTS